MEAVLASSSADAAIEFCSTRPSFSGKPITVTSEGGMSSVFVVKQTFTAIKILRTDAPAETIAQLPQPPKLHYIARTCNRETSLTCQAETARDAILTFLDNVSTSWKGEVEAKTDDETTWCVFRVCYHKMGWDVSYFGRRGYAETGPVS